MCSMIKKVTQLGFVEPHKLKVIVINHSGCIRTAILFLKNTVKAAASYFIVKVLQFLLVLLDYTILFMVSNSSFLLVIAYMFSVIA